jgi:TonB-dependent SusC/RagA subfamily outer membrane receptor
MRRFPRAIEAVVVAGSSALAACAHAPAKGNADGQPPSHADIARAVSDSAMAEGRPSDARTMEDMFAGRFPGLDVIRLPSGGITFRIRGVSTIMGRSDPLIIVDGIELQSGDGLLSLNPDDIARIEVLKDAASTAAYGVRGANGVIVITTKRAR